MNVDGVLAADRDGHVAALSLGSPSTLLARVGALLRSNPLVVADLPGGGEGRSDLVALSAGREPGELLIVVQRAAGRSGHELLWVAVAGLAGGGGRRAELAEHQRSGA